LILVFVFFYSEPRGVGDKEDMSVDLNFKKNATIILFFQPLLLLVDTLFAHPVVDNYAKTLGEYQILNSDGVGKDLLNRKSKLEALRNILMQLNDLALSDNDLLMINDPSLPKVSNDATQDLSVAIFYYQFWVDFNKSKIKNSILNVRNSHINRLKNSGILEAKTFLEECLQRVKERKEKIAENLMPLLADKNKDVKVFAQQLLNKTIQSSGEDK